MKWLLQRYSDDGNSTLGLMFKVIDYAGKPKLHFFCDTLEDEYRDVKVMHETRIPAGTYELKIRREDTPLTVKHRVSYNKGYASPWFFYHLEVCDVKGFTGIYVHVGNTDLDTSGCILLGYGKDKINKRQSINMSMLAVKDFYGQVYTHLDYDKKNKAYLEIRDELTV